MSFQQFAVPSPSVRRDVAPSLSPPWAPNTQGGRLAEHRAVQGTGAPDIRYSWFVWLLFCKVKCTGITGDKKTHRFVLPTARGLVLCNRYSCKLQKCYSKCFFYRIIQIGMSFSNRALKCRMHIMSDSAGINISKTNRISSIRKTPAVLSTWSLMCFGQYLSLYQWKLIKRRYCRLTEPCCISSCQSLTFLIH